MKVNKNSEAAWVDKEPRPLVNLPSTYTPSLGWARTDASLALTSALLAAKSEQATQSGKGVCNTLSGLNTLLGVVKVLAGQFSLA